jgi:hypothetical protein
MGIGEPKMPTPEEMAKFEPRSSERILSDEELAERGVPGFEHYKVDPDKQKEELAQREQQAALLKKQIEAQEIKQNDIVKLIYSDGDEPETVKFIELQNDGWIRYNKLGLETGYQERPVKKIERVELVEKKELEK